MDKDIIFRVRKRLLKKTKNISDINNLQPNLNPKKKPKTPPIAAAVLVPIIERDDNYSVLYTKRSEKLRNHSGQIAFPGGKIDKNDENIAAAAIREAYEEVAILPEEVEILGYMPSIFTGTNYLITPVVGLVKPTNKFIANKEEVAEFFEVPLDFLLKEQAYQATKIFYAKKLQKTWTIQHKDKHIWGITAHITRYFWQMALKE